MAKSIKPNRRKLTPLFVQRQKGADRASLVWDADQRHLALRTQPSGSRAWYCVYSRHGRPRWLRLGDARSIGLKDARVLAAEAMLSVNKDDRDPAAERKAQRSKGTFEELAKRYLEEYAKKKNKSWRQGDFLVRRYLLPRWGKLQVGAISRADVKSVLSKIEKKPALANQILASASAVFSWAADEQIIAANANPCTGVARNETKTRERVLGDSEIPKFWAAFDDAGLIAGSALKTILLLGQRPGEVANMRREHISDNWWTLPGDPVPALGWPGTKNKQTHRVWLPAPVLELLGELDDEPPAAGFVFAGGRNRLAGAMRAICSKLKVERATPHDLRRTHGTTVTTLGLGRHIMDVIQNHKKRGVVTDTYDRYAYGPEIKTAMETVAAHLVALAEGTQVETNVVPMFAGRGPKPKGK
jgi:integrase